MRDKPHERLEDAEYEIGDKSWRMTLAFDDALEQLEHARTLALELRAQVEKWRKAKADCIDEAKR